MSFISVFDVMGPNMIGPSSSHTAGAARISYLAQKMIEGPLKTADFILYGSFAKTYHGHGTDRALLGGIMGFSTDDMRIRNSFDIAHEKGLKFSFTPNELETDIHPNTVDICMENEKEKNKKEISLEKITGKNYVGFVMTIPDASKVKLVDGRKSSRGSKLSEIVTSNNAIAGINAGGFSDDGGVGAGNLLNTATIMNKTLQYGNKTSRYSFIGLSSDSKLVLGKYTYQEALNHKIESAIEFGPYLIVNGKNQISNSNSGRNST